MKINNKSIKKIQHEQGWSGKGTEHDPIIIDSMPPNESFLKIQVSNIYLVINNVDIRNIYLKKSQNVVIEGCKIYYLLISMSKDLIIRKNILYSFLLDNTRASVIEANQIDKKYRDFEKTWDVSVKELKEVAFVLFIVLFIFMMFIGGFFFGILLLTFTYIGLLIYWIVIIRNEKKMKNFAENNVIDNEFIDLRDEFNN